MEEQKVKTTEIFAQKSGSPRTKQGGPRITQSRRPLVRGSKESVRGSMWSNFSGHSFSIVLAHFQSEFAPGSFMKVGVC